jgi:hypothetical protein
MWEYSLDDMRVRIRLKIGEQQAKVHQDYQTLALIVSEAFGGKKSETPQTATDAVANFQALFRKP